MGKIAEVMQLHLPLLIHPSRLNDAELIHDLQTMTASFSIDVLIQQLEAMLKDSSSLPLHPSIQAPTLIVHSCQDALFPQDHAILASGIKNSKLKAIEECGHASPMEKPQEVTDLIGAFLRETA